MSWYATWYVMSYHIRLDRAYDVLCHGVLRSTIVVVTCYATVSIASYYKGVVSASMR